MLNALSLELAEMAARHIAEEGLTYAQAKRKAAKQAGIAEHNAQMPDNSTIEQALRDYLAEHYADSHPDLLHGLRQTAVKWMQWLENLAGSGVQARCLVTGAVVNGTATEWSAVHLQVFTEDSKFLEMALLNRGLNVDASEQAIAGQMRPVIVVQDQGLPIVMTLMPAVDYRPAKTIGAAIGAAGVQQYANRVQLQALCDGSVQS